MTDRRTSDVMGGLPHSRPHRRSDKRGSRPAEADPVEQDSSGGQSVPKRAPARTTKARASKSGTAKTAAGPKAASGRKSAASPKAASGRKAAGTPKISSARKSPSRSGATRPPIRQPAQPGGTPRAARAAQPEPPDRSDILGTAVQAAAELAEIGLTVGARALRSAMSRLPRP